MECKLLWDKSFGNYFGEILNDYFDNDLLFNTKE